MVTVFTSVYNRAYIINQLYQSLLRQTNYNFEWLIIDDGSTDHIMDLVSQWIAHTEEFEVRFYQQSNGGKHRAINKAVQLSKGDAFLIVDSDDYLTDDAIEMVLKYWQQIKCSPEFVGISGLRIHQDMCIIGDRPHFEEFVDATNLERDEYGLKGDKAEVYKTEVLKAFPFPEFEGENFITEAVVWNKIAYCGYKIRWINKGIMVCDYLEDGLTVKKDEPFMQNPKGWAEYLRNERIYQAWSESIYLRKCLRYYETEHLHIAVDEMKELLGLDSNEMDKVIEAYSLLQMQFMELCKDKKVCIYAYGRWGKRLRRYLDEIHIRIEYIIDQKCLETNRIARYDPKLDLPEVDIVLVALKSESDDVMTILKGKMEQTQIISLKEIVEEWW